MPGLAKKFHESPPCHPPGAGGIHWIDDEYRTGGIDDAAGKEYLGGGGDPRRAALAELLADDGHSVHTYALERGEGVKCEPSMAGADRADCVVLPLPAAGPDGRLNAPLAAESHTLAEVLDALRPGQLVCAGMAGEALERMAQERELVLRDYFAREELAVMNAIPAALAVW